MLPKLGEDGAKGATGPLATVSGEPDSVQGARSLRYMPTPASARANRTASKKIGMGRGGSHGSNVGSISSTRGGSESGLTLIAFLSCICCYLRSLRAVDLGRASCREEWGQ